MNSPALRQRDFIPFEEKTGKSMNSPALRQRDFLPFEKKTEKSMNSLIQD